MTIEEAIVAQLKATAGVTAIIGAGDAARVFPQVLPQGSAAQKYPGLVFQRISGPREHSLTGRSGLANPRFQFTCWSKRHAEARALADAVTLALDSFSGTLGGGGGVDTSPILVEDGPDGYDDAEQVYSCSLDAICWHAE